MSSFHFLWPEYLLLLFPAWALVWWLLKEQSDERKWQKLIEPKLLRHLLVEPKRDHAKIAAPWHLGIVLSLLIVAVSGPSWKLKDSPFAQDDTRIVLVVAVKPSMLTTDITPNRLARAVIKLTDLLKRRSDTRAALIAYSGTAHLVLPFTEDHAIVTTFAEALNPKIMPLEGENIKEALLLAQKTLGKEAGTIIVMSDSLSPSSVNLAKNEGLKAGTKVLFWQMASSSLSNEADFKSAASLLAGDFVAYAGDESDVAEVSAMIERNFKSAAQEDSSRYEDGGYWLIPFIFLLLLPWARQGFFAELWRRA